MRKESRPGVGAETAENRMREKMTAVVVAAATGEMAAVAIWRRRWGGG